MGGLRKLIRRARRLMPKQPTSQQDLQKMCQSALQKLPNRQDQPDLFPRLSTDIPLLNDDYLTITFHDEYKSTTFIVSQPINQEQYVTRHTTIDFLDYSAQQRLNNELIERISL